MAADFVGKRLQMVVRYANTNAFTLEKNRMHAPFALELSTRGWSWGNTSDLTIQVPTLNTPTAWRLTAAPSAQTCSPPLRTSSFTWSTTATWTPPWNDNPRWVLESTKEGENSSRMNSSWSRTASRTTIMTIWTVSKRTSRKVTRNVTGERGIRDGYPRDLRLLLFLLKIPWRIPTLTCIIVVHLPSRTSIQ